MSPALLEDACVEEVSCHRGHARARARGRLPGERHGSRGLDRRGDRGGQPEPPADTRSDRGGAADRRSAGLREARCRSGPLRTGGGRAGDPAIARRSDHKAAAADSNAQTDVYGVCRLDFLPTVRYTIRISHYGGSGWTLVDEVRITVKADTTTRAKVQLGQ